MHTENGLSLLAGSSASASTSRNTSSENPLPPPNTEPLANGRSASAAAGPGPASTSASASAENLRGSKRLSLAPDAPPPAAAAVPKADSTDGAADAAPQPPPPAGASPQPPEQTDAARQLDAAVCTSSIESASANPRNSDLHLLWSYQFDRISRTADDGDRVLFLEFGAAGEQVHSRTIYSRIY